MPIRTPRRIARFFLAASTACLCALAPRWASAFPVMAAPIPVVEYYNVQLHHYFLTAHADEMAAIDAGSAGPGWTRTGWAFSAFPAGSTFCIPDCGAAVERFYSASSNSHFYTADRGEAAGIEQPGSEWALEREEFRVPVPDANGQCTTGQVPVYRLYNDRFAFHDSNHRFVTDAGERAKMVAEGWIDEGVRFCALDASEIPIESYSISASWPTPVMASAQCEDESIHRGACIAINNLPVPASLYPVGLDGLLPAAFSELTGQALARRLFVVPPAGADKAALAFVEDSDATIGVHVDTRGRGASPYSSVNPLYQFHTTVDPGKFDDRFFPWAPRESDVELQLQFTLNVKSIEASTPGSAAYGHPTIEFIDQRSGHHLYFTVMTYGTPPAVPAGDYLAPDVGTGKVIVGTTFRADSPFGRSLGLSTLALPSTGFVAPNPWGWGGSFEFRVDRGEFQNVLDAARTVDGALSASPADYMVDNFHFNNEVFGDGEIGLNLAGYRLRLLRR
jgi:hypothetical protein